MTHTVESLLALAFDAMDAARVWAIKNDDLTLASLGRKREALRAALTEALKERDALQAEVESLQSTLARIEKKVDALIAERDALKLDAERYRWLRTWTVLWSDKPQGEFNSVCLDKSIDAAMKGAA